jgi:hypothetical protein
MALGAALLILGLLGIASGGHDHDLWVFGVNASHNWIHLLSGGLGIMAALLGYRATRGFLLAFGTLYGMVALTGFLGVGALARLLNLNLADNLLHLAVSSACLMVVVTSPRARIIDFPALSSPMHRGRAA